MLLVSTKIYYYGNIMKNNNLWAPWRIEYLKSFTKEDGSLADDAPWHKNCFLCDYWKTPDQDRKNLVLWRTENCLVLFNRFPYTGGHLLIAPQDHVANLEALSKKTILDMMLLSCDAQKVLSEAIHPHGYNIGININRCAGAGLPDHVHLHLVPRWDGDTNFMSTISDVRLVSQSLEDLYDHLIKISKKLNLPKS